MNRQQQTAETLERIARLLKFIAAVWVVIALSVAANLAVSLWNSNGHTG
jgi:hypothetical protein